MFLKILNKQLRMGCENMTEKEMKRARDGFLIGLFVSILIGIILGVL